MHAAEAAAVGQTLRDGEPVVVEVEEALLLLLLLLEEMVPHLLLGTAAVGIWYERQLAIEILLVLLLLLLLEWIHHMAAELLLLLALEGIWIVVEGSTKGICGLNIATGGRGRLCGAFAGLQFSQLLVEILKSGISILTGRHRCISALGRTGRMAVLQGSTHCIVDGSVIEVGKVLSALMTIAIEELLLMLLLLQLLLLLEMSCPDGLHLGVAIAGTH